MLDSMGVQEVRWKRGGTKTARGYIFFYGKEKENHELGTGCFAHKRIISAVKKVEFVSDRLSYVILRDRCCDVIGLNVYAPTGVQQVTCKTLTAIKFIGMVITV
jgi:hypothetical protein